jgi:hypothetical protein
MEVHLDKLRGTFLTIVILLSTIDGKRDDTRSEPVKSSFENLVIYVIDLFIIDFQQHARHRLFT